MLMSEATGLVYLLEWLFTFVFTMTCKVQTRF